MVEIEKLDITVGPFSSTVKIPLKLWKNIAPKITLEDCGIDGSKYSTKISQKSPILPLTEFANVARGIRTYVYVEPTPFN